MTTDNIDLDKPEAEKPWYAVYPTPKITASPITCEMLLSWFQQGKISGKDFVLVDLRRMDHEVGYQSEYEEIIIYIIEKKIPRELDD